MEYFVNVLVYVMLLASSQSIQLPSHCEVDQYFEPSDLNCQHCPTNVSMVPSPDGKNVIPYYFCNLMSITTPLPLYNNGVLHYTLISILSV